MNILSSKALTVVPFFMMSVLPSLAALVPVPDGEFESGQGAWFELSGGGVYSFEYPSTGGNPDGHGIIDNTGGGGFGIWISGFNSPTPLANLGLSAGETYTFSLDMKIFSGPNLGEFKVDFFNGDSFTVSTGDLRPEVIGDGSDWATYSFEIPVPSGSDGLKIIPIEGSDSRVGFDNIVVENTAIVQPTSIPDADFSAADGVAWETTDKADAGTFVFSFPATGGNDGGHAVIDHSANDGGSGVLVANNGEILQLSALGLAPGFAYDFEMDMQLLSGSEIGGLKVEFFNGPAEGSDTGDLYPELIGDGSTWETYQFRVEIPATSNGIKIVPLFGDGSVVGYDNVGFDPTQMEIPDAPAITEIPNGDFEEGSDSWDTGGEPNTVFTYEATGGNPDGFGVMTSNGSGFGVWVANGGTAIPLEELGLVAGETYLFKQDMRLFSGNQIGGLKVEFSTGPDTGDLRIPLIGDGSTWETYEYEVAIPLGAESLTLVPLWGAGSSVGYDNFTFETEPIETPPPAPSPPVLNPGFELGGSNWSGFVSASGASFRFVETGGNPDGYAEMTNDGVDGSFAVLVANSATVAPLSDFGITEAGNYQFQMDMRIFEGLSLGALKIEYFQGGAMTGDTGDLVPALIGDGSTWETYTFDVFIPGGIDGLQVVLVGGFGSTVGFDNVVTPLPANGYEGWIAGFPDVGELTGFNDDADGDGQPNGLENYLGTDPSKPSEGLITGSVDAAVSRLSFTHGLNSEPVPEAANGVYEWSTDLVTFYQDRESNPEGMSVNFNAVENSPVAGQSTVTATVFGASGERIFVRLSVSELVE